MIAFLKSITDLSIEFSPPKPFSASSSLIGAYRVGETQRSHRDVFRQFHERTFDECPLLLEKLVEERMFCI